MTLCFIKMSAHLSTRRVPPRSQLTAMAGLVGLREAENLSSSELMHRLGEHGFPRLLRMLKRQERHKRCKKEQRTDKRKKRKKHKKRERSDTMSVTPKKMRRVLEPQAAVDPILLCPLPKDPKMRFSYVRPNGLVVEYACESLADYLLCSGQFREPETRLPFTDVDLRRLDKQIKDLGMKKESVLRAKYCHNWTERKFRMSAMQGLDRIIGQIVAHILSRLESFCEDSEPGSEAQLELLSKLQEMSDYYAQLRGVDRSYAETCLDMHIAYLRGPKNRPTRDPYGLLKMCTDFIGSFRRMPFFFIETSQGLAVVNSGGSSISPAFSRSPNSSSSPHFRRGTSTSGGEPAVHQYSTESSVRRVGQQNTVQTSSETSRVIQDEAASETQGAYSARSAISSSSAH